MCLYSNLVPRELICAVAAHISTAYLVSCSAYWRASLTRTVFTSETQSYGSSSNSNECKNRAPSNIFRTPSIRPPPCVPWSPAIGRSRRTPLEGGYLSLRLPALLLDRLLRSIARCDWPRQSSRSKLRVGLLRLATIEFPTASVRRKGCVLQNKVSVDPKASAVVPQQCTVSPRSLLAQSSPCWFL